MADTTLTTTQGAVAERKGLGAKVTGFFEEVNREIKKVTWPTREELQDATIITLVLCIVFSLFVFGVDKIFEVLLRLMYSL